MSKANVYRTGRLSDKKVIELLDAIEKKFGCQSTNVLIGTLPVNYKAEENKSLFHENTSSITAATIHTANHNFTIKFRRGVSDDVQEHEKRRPSSYFDEIIIVLGVDDPRRSRKAPTPQDAIKCDETVRKFVTNVIPENVEDGANSAINLLQAEIESLATQYKDMVKGLDDRRAKLDKEHDKKLADLEEERKKQNNEFEEQKKLDEALVKLKEKELNEREKSLDDRDHMHVRRSLRENINTDVKDRLTKTIVSPSAHLMRWGVFFMAIMVAGALGYVSFISLTEFGSLGADALASVEERQDFSAQALMQDQSIATLVSVSGWFLILKTILSSIGAIGAFFYAVAWLRRLYLDDVRTERELERYAYDINRASWAIETIMEMQNTKNSIPPQTWIEAVCGNLFSDNSSNTHHEISTPLEALLNSSAKVEFGPNGTKFELSKRGAKKLAKDIHSND